MDTRKVAGCDICAVLAADEQVVVFETASWRVSLAPDQYYLGRAYVTSLRHVPELSGLSTAEFKELWEVIRRYEKAAKQNLDATHVTWMALMNNAYRVSRPLPHVHWHVRPRYAHPVRIGDKVFDDPEFGNHHQRDMEDVVSIELLREICAQLQR